MAYTAGDIMDLSARLLNDRLKSLYTYEIQLPYLQMAADDLDLQLESVSAPIQNDVCDIDLDAAATSLTLPCDFFLPLTLQERNQTSTNIADYVDMIEKEFEQSMPQTDVLNYWSFRDNKIKFIGSTVAKTIKLRYRRNLQTLVDYSIVAEVNKAKNFLSLRTAEYCSGSVGGTNGNNRTAMLAAKSMVALDDLLSVIVKGNQGARVRRKPYRVRATPFYVSR